MQNKWVRKQEAIYVNMMIAILAAVSVITELHTDRTVKLISIAACDKDPRANKVAIVCIHEHSTTVPQHAC